ncbi:DUF6153 family protein [Nocardia sp. NPDC088792]|uniref:DUF6153 family protein n=1 Tax=Nocardia sp. NPDC088792 TaxID=3364332 RepID=UPI0037FFCFDD
MVGQQAAGTRYLRALGLFALLAGLVAMHSLVIGMNHEGSGHREMSSQTVVAAVMSEHRDMSAPACAGSDCGSGHAGMHGCLFVLSALLFLLGLALLAWVGLRRGDRPLMKVRQARPHRARPPPWTVLTLSELAILRI